jgi:hypothetical protein
MALTFTDLVALSTTGLSALLFFIHRFASKNAKYNDWVTSKFALTLLGLCCLISSFSLLLLSFFVRNDTWFVLRIISLIFVSFYSLFKKSSFIIPLYLLIIVISSSIAPIVSLGFSAGEPDQIGHLLAVNYILANHKISSVQEAAFGNAQYYGNFPMIDFLASSFALVTGATPLLTFAILEVMIPVFAVLALLEISFGLTHNYLPATVAVLLMLSTDRLAIWVLIPQNFSAVLALAAILSLMLFVTRPSVVFAFLVIVFSLSSNFAHASFGGFLLLTILVLSLIAYMQKLSFWPRFMTLVVGAAVGLVSYWTIWNISPNVSGNVNGVIQSFLNAISGRVVHLVGARTESLIALITPYNFISWAVPPALALSFMANRLLVKKFKIDNKLDAFLASGTGVGFFILAIGLFSTYNQGSIALERYTDVPAYVAMMIIGSMGAAILMTSGKKLFAYTVMTILIISLIAGSISLDWTPDQISSTYGFAGHEEYTFTHSLSKLLPSSIDIFFAQKLMYTDYWNLSKATTFISPSDFLAINNNRSTSTSYLVSFSLHSRTNVYYALGPSLVKDYNNLTNSPNMDFILSNGQYVVVDAQP